MKKFLGFILSSFLAFVLTITLVSANSAARSWRPKGSYGVCLVEDNPIDVLREDLVFDFGLNSDENSVSAEYTFYNSSADDIEAELIFPIGTAENEYSSERYKYNPEVYVDSVKLDTTMRLLKIFSSSAVSIVEAVENLSDTYDESMLDNYDYYKCIIDKPASVEKEYYDIQVQNAYIANDENIFYQRYGDNSFYPCGDDYFYFATRDDYDINISCRSGAGEPNYTVESATKYDFVKQANKYIYGEEIYDYYTEVDLYNMYVAQDNLYEFVAAIDYSISIPAHGTIKNKVVTNLYAGWDDRYEDSVNAFIYYLTPAKSFRSFKDLNITINTHGVYLIENNMDLKKVNKSSTTYTKHYDTLPDFDLKIETCEYLNPTKRKSPWSSIGTAIGNFVFMTCIIAMNILFIVGTIVPMCIQIKKKVLLKNIYVFIENIVICLTANIPLVTAILEINEVIGNKYIVPFIIGIALMITAISLRLVGALTVNKKYYNKKTWIFDSIAIGLESILILLCLPMDKGFIFIIILLCFVLFAINIVYMFVRQKFRINIEEEAKEN